MIDQPPVPSGLPSDSVSVPIYLVNGKVLHSDDDFERARFRTDQNKDESQKQLLSESTIDNKDEIEEKQKALDKIYDNQIAAIEKLKEDVEKLRETAELRWYFLTPVDYREIFKVDSSRKTVVNGETVIDDTPAGRLLLETHLFDAEGKKPDRVPPAAAIKLANRLQAEIYPDEALIPFLLWKQAHS